MNGYSKNLSLLSTSCIQYLLVLTKVSLVYKTFFQSLAFLLYIINLFYCSVQETLSPDLFAASADRGGATWEGGANGWRLKKLEIWALFPCNQWTCSYHHRSLLFVVSSLRYWSQLECTLEIIERQLLLHPWFNTSLSSVKDRLEQLMRNLWQNWRDVFKI